ncbi:MAG TPA: Ni/Fe-hydrogenase cytochrome b subunit [Bryobacteraceae bacterium]|nr:Ni/Fe-hydrogenase cytochrome b subunit [Bryobacteraceae bacterium]
MLQISEPVLTRPFWLMVTLAALGLVLCTVREFVGLHAVTALNDGYSWGLFKNFNVTTLTALGSGGYAMALLTYVCNQGRFHSLMRTALLTSILSYTVGMLALAVDIGRPWNLFFMVDPWTWNPHSILWEVAFCMTAYVMIALDFENLAPLLEGLEDENMPKLVRDLAGYAKRFVKTAYPYGVALALALPTMHQSSLGSLMLLGGTRVHPLWQTHLLPLFYVVMAFILGIAFVELVLMASCAVWRRPVDNRLLASLSNIVSWTTAVWLAIRFGDIAMRGQLGAVLRFDFYGILFLSETALIAVPAMVLRSESRRLDPSRAFPWLCVLTIGGMLYRYTPTTIAFRPGEGYHYFPSVPELLISTGFIALAMMGYLFTVKRFAILPATLEMSVQAAVTKSIKKEKAA